MAESKKALLTRVKEEKVGMKLSFKKGENHGIWSITSHKQKGEKWKQYFFFFLSSKTIAGGDMKLKDICFSEEKL